MKVLFVTNVLAPYRAMFFSMLGNYCELTVLAELDSVKSRDDKWYPTKYNNYNYISLHGKAFYHEDITFGIGVVNSIRKDKYDWVIFGTYTDPSQIVAIEYCRLVNQRYIISDDGCFISDNKLLVNLLKRHILSNASAYLTTSDCAIKTLNFYGVKKNIYKYPFSSIMGKDIANTDDLYNKKYYKNKLKIKEGKIIICVARSIPIKGIDVLLECLSAYRLSEIGVYIIGGECTEEYKNIIDKEKIFNVRFIPFVQPEVLRLFYKAADCFVLPTRGDTWGLVINEAIAQGLPVVTTERCLAGTELIKDGINGFLVPINNSSLLADKVNEIITDDDLAIEMGRNNIKLAHSFTIETMVDTHRKILDALSSLKG